MPKDVTLDWTEYEGLKHRIKMLEENAAAAPPAPVDETAQANALLAALEVVKFAIGNLPPESVAGWPHTHLTNLAAALTEMGTYAPELATTIRQFARECRELAIFRANREAVARAVLSGTEDETHENA